MGKKPKIDPEHARPIADRIRIAPDGASVELDLGDFTPRRRGAPTTLTAEDARALAIELLYGLRW